jgi:hypothetical protein
MVVGSLVSDAATVAGLTAAAIAVTGFLLHAGPALSGATEDELRRATVVSGLLGFGAAVFVMLLSAVLG